MNQLQLTRKEKQFSKNLLQQKIQTQKNYYGCLLYTSDAADERSSVDLGGRRIIKKKNNEVQEGRDAFKNNNDNTPNTTNHIIR